MGGDASFSVKGLIHFNSLTDTVGTSQITHLREGTTFSDAHTVQGEDNQSVGTYYRKWRYFSGDINTTSISAQLTSASDYSIAGNYGRQFGITYQNYFNTCDNGGTIKFETVSHSSPYTPSMVEYNSYTLEAINQTYKSIDYTFNHWELDGTNKGSNNPYNFPGSFGYILQARFTGKPINNYRSLSLSMVVNQPITLTWHHHPSESINGYRIYRKVRPNGGSLGSEELVATFNNRMDTTYVDYDYIYSNYFFYQVYYDVRAYYPSDGTMSDPDFVSTYAQQTLIANNNNKQQAVSKEIPSEYSISNYPNPFNPTTTINYSLPADGMVTLKVYDILAREVATLVNESKQAGYYNVTFDAGKLTSGMYIYTITANGYVQSKKMMLMK